MISVGTRAHGALRRRPLNGLDVDIHKSEWMQSSEGVDGHAPTVSLIEQVPDSTLCTHFHRQNQFQLFVQGGGVFGGDALQPVTVHYAGAYTGYGPLASGPGGLDYFTIRMVPEADAFPVEMARDVMIRGPKRQAKSKPTRGWAPDRLAALVSPHVEDLIPISEDGLGALHVCVPADAELQQAAPTAADGTFVVVLGGSLICGDATLQRWESLFLSSDESLTQIRAGSAGLEAALLFMPPKAECYGAPAKAS